MASDRSVFGGVIAVTAIGLVALVYGMEISGGQAMNAPAIVGGILILLAIGVLTVRIARLPTQ